MVRKHQTSDVQLHIGESRGSRFARCTRAPERRYSFFGTTRNVALARAMTRSSAFTKHCAKQIVLPVLITSLSTVSHCPIWALLMKSIDMLTVTSELAPRIL